MQTYLLPLRDYIAALREQLANCEWIGDDAQAKCLQERIDYARELVDKGDVYMPLF